MDRDRIGKHGVENLVTRQRANVFEKSGAGINGHRQSFRPAATHSRNAQPLSRKEHHAGNADDFAVASRNRDRGPTDSTAISQSFAIEGPLDLRATLGQRVKVERDGDDVVHEAWWASRTPDGLATARVRTTRSNANASAWGPGAEWLLRTVPDRLGLNDDNTTFTTHHPVIARIHRDNRGLRLGRTGLVWEALAPTILGQKVTTIEANRSWRSLVYTYGDKAPGPTTLRVGPTPQTLANLAYHQLHEHGIERKRADILITCAREADHLETIVDLPAADAYARLTAIPGIGIWTASLVIGAAHGDPDAIPVGDFHVPNMVSWALARERRGSDERMIELLEPYRGHRRRVIRLLHLGKISVPKYGPRMAPRDIRGW